MVPKLWKQSTLIHIVKIAILRLVMTTSLDLSNCEVI